MLQFFEPIEDQNNFVAPIFLLIGCRYHQQPTVGKNIVAGVRTSLRTLKTIGKKNMSTAETRWGAWLQRNLFY